MQQGFVAELAQLFLKVVVFAEPAAQGALADVGLARGSGDRARGEHGLDGAFLAGGQSVVEDVGATSLHMLTLAGDWRKARRGFVKLMVLGGIKIRNYVTGIFELRFFAVLLLADWSDSSRH